MTVAAPAIVMATAPSPPVMMATAAAVPPPVAAAMTVSTVAAVERDPTTPDFRDHTKTIEFVLEDPIGVVER